MFVSNRRNFFREPGILSINVSLALACNSLGSENRNILKFLSLISMDSDQISSSSDEFDFSLIKEQITSIHEELSYETNESSGIIKIVTK